MWFFRNCLVQADVLNELFDGFVDRIDKAGLILNQGKIVDATMVKAPVQRNTRQENKRIKDGKAPKGWSENKARQKGPPML